MSDKRIGDMSDKELAAFAQGLGIGFVKCRVVEDSDDDDGDGDEGDGGDNEPGDESAPTVPAASSAASAASSAPAASSATAASSAPAASSPAAETAGEAPAAEAPAPSMFTIAFHERQLKGVSEHHWAMIPVPFQVPGMDAKSSGRSILRGDVDESTTACRIPAKGRAYIIGAGATVVHSFDYAIPHVSSVEMPASSGLGMVRTSAPSLDEFPAYGALEKKKWFQLNPTTDPYTVQLHMVKLPPEDVYRSISRGEYFVYSPIGLVLRPPASMAGPAGSSMPAVATATLVGTAAAAGSPSAIRSALSSLAAKAVAVTDIDKVTSL